jgi:predicted ABC-type ATPase
MQVIIFEGIPTSGKTSTMNALKSQLGDSVEIIYEDETLMKILDNKDESMVFLTGRRWSDGRNFLRFRGKQG